MFSTLKPRFQFGASNSNYCDCLGLLILQLKSEGFTISWEESINRRSVKLSSIIQQFQDNGFIKADKRAKKGYLAAIMRLENEDGHIGVYDVTTKTVWHMSYYGILATTDLSNVTLWKYKGE